MRRVALLMLILAGCTATAETPPPVHLVLARGGDGALVQVLVDEYEGTFDVIPPNATRLTFTTPPNAPPLACIPGPWTVIVQEPVTFDTTCDDAGGPRWPAVHPVDGNLDGAVETVAVVPDGSAPAESVWTPRGFYREATLTTPWNSSVAAGDVLFTACTSPLRVRLGEAWHAWWLPCDAAEEPKVALVPVGDPAAGVRVLVTGPLVTTQFEAVWVGRSVIPGVLVQGPGAFHPVGGVTPEAPAYAPCPARGLHTLVLRSLERVLESADVTCGLPPAWPVVLELEAVPQETGGSALRATLQRSELGPLVAEQGIGWNRGAAPWSGPWRVGESFETTCPGGSVVLTAGDSVAWFGPAPC